VRKTTVSFEGQSFQIGSFTIREVKYFWDVNTPVPPDKIEAHTNAYLCAALNKAMDLPFMVVDEPKAWTATKLEDAVDIPTRNFLIDAVMKFNGLRVEGGAKGEDPAAAAPGVDKVAPWPTTSSGSAAASSPA
jgi:hypothetical protein